MKHGTVTADFYITCFITIHVSICLVSYIIDLVCASRIWTSHILSQHLALTGTNRVKNMIIGMQDIMQNRICWSYPWWMERIWKV